MEIINMMPYDMNVYGLRQVSEGPLFIYQKTGKIARVIATELGTIQGPDLWYEAVHYGELEEFPDVQPDVMYIVPLVSAIAARTRGDLLSPYKKVRNQAGFIVGCRYLQKVV